jgi:hypothetical protein
METVFESKRPVYLKMPGSDTHLKLMLTAEGLEITSTDQGLCIIPCVSNSVVIKLKDYDDAPEFHHQGALAALTQHRTALKAEEDLKEKISKSLLAGAPESIRSLLKNAQEHGVSAIEDNSGPVAVCSWKTWKFLHLIRDGKVVCGADPGNAAIRQWNIPSEIDPCPECLNLECLRKEKDERR